MAKMASLSGAVTGKLAGNVYSVNSGQQIVRAYQPNVANPSTELQVENRAKFKLASQLAAAVSPVLAIGKQGMVSGRNQFVSATMDAISFALGEATVRLNKLQFTKSSIELPALSVTRGEAHSATASLAQSAAVLGVTKVVYVIFKQTEGEKLELLNKRVVSEAGADGRFATQYDNIGSAQLFFYAYGIIEDENSMLAKYDSYLVDDATFVASIISSRSGVASGLKTTTTSYAYVAAE